LRLPALTRDVEIDYTALSLVVPEKVQFRYTVEGRDKDWQEAGNRRQTFYSDLPPRNYRFRVVACNNSGLWNEAGASFDFAVAPAYYQTRLFRVSGVARFLLLLWVLYQIRVRQVAREYNMHLEGRVSERTRIARELHDTLLQSFQGLLLRFSSCYLRAARPSGGSPAKLRERHRSGGGSDYRGAGCGSGTAVIDEVDERSCQCDNHFRNRACGR